MQKYNATVRTASKVIFLSRKTYWGVISNLMKLERTDALIHIQLTTIKQQPWLN